MIGYFIDRLLCLVGKHVWAEGYVFLGYSVDYCESCGKAGVWREWVADEHREA